LIDFSFGMFLGRSHIEHEGRLLRRQFCGQFPWRDRLGLLPNSLITLFNVYEMI
jgi:hypothetical protein